MSKIIGLMRILLDKVLGHKYTGFSIKTPFINVSFAPTNLPALYRVVFLGEEATLQNSKVALLVR